MIPAIEQVADKTARIFGTVTRIATSPRMWMHLPMGLVNGYALVRYPALGVGALLCFIVYEIAQDHNIKDNAYQDILGHVVGLFVMCIVMALLDAWRFING